MRIISAGLLLLLLTAPAARAAEPIDVGSRRELFVDRYLIETLRGVSLHLQQPVPRETVLRIDRAWEGPFNAGQCVLPYEGKYHLYYRGMAGPRPGDPPEAQRSAICLATSRDGVVWTKPILRAAEADGLRETNLIADDRGRPIVPGFDVFLDTRPGVPEGERIKGACYYAGGARLTPVRDVPGAKRPVLFVSADGVRFAPMKRQPDLVTSLPNAFDSLNAFFWSEAEQKYLCYFRIMDPYRSVARSTSSDLIHWSRPAPMDYGATPREQIYTNQTTAYFRAPQIYVALAARFMQGRRVLGRDEAARLGMATSGSHVYDNDCSDAVLMTSRAGSNCYDRTFLEGFVRPGIGQGNWGSRSNYPLQGIVETGPAEMSFYVNRHYAQKTWHIQRCTLRLDGFASLHAPFAGGEAVTRPLRFSGRRLAINFATSAAGGVRVEIQSPDGKPLAGYTLADCPEIVGDQTERIVTWTGGPDLSGLAGKPVRLRFVLKDADVFAFQFL